jgi:hypothetical protein
MLKITEEKQLVNYGGNAIRLTAEFSMETMRDKRV